MIIAVLCTPPHSAVFSTEEGITYSTLLSPISLNLTDLFLPIPANLQEKVAVATHHKLGVSMVVSITYRFLLTCSSPSSGPTLNPYSNHSEFFIFTTATASLGPVDSLVLETR
jgi:hypothetical protein